MPSGTMKALYYSAVRTGDRLCMAPTGHNANATVQLVAEAV